MFSTRQAVEIIEKLIELTQHNEIIWTSIAPSSFMLGPDSRVDVVYVASYIGRNIRIYHQQFKYYLDEERYTWDEQVKFEFIDDSGSIMAELPRTANSYNLLKSIQFQNPKINNFYNDLFN